MTVLPGLFQRDRHGTIRRFCDNKWRSLGLALAGLLVDGCGSAGTPVRAPDVREEPLPPRSVPSPYRLAIGDVVAVRFYNNPELDEEQPIRPDGMISLPFVGQVEAWGLTTAELEAELAERYAGELRSPRITVIVRDFVEQRVYLGGEVRTPGAYELRGDVTLYQAIQQVGGFLETARRQQVLVMRQDSSGSPVVRSINMKQVQTGANPDADVLLQADDVVFVPRSRIANVNVWMRLYVSNNLPIQGNFVTGALVGSASTTSTN